MAATGRHRDAGRMGASAMRRLNGALLLDLIRSKGPVSRADLSRLSGLTKPTVSSQVADLLSRGLVAEAGEGEPDERGGKPSRLLRFEPGCGNVIGVEICASKVRVRMADMDGTILDREDARIRPERGAEEILATIAETCKTVTGRGRGRKQKLKTMVVAAPGRVDVHSGAVLEAGNVFHWRNVGVGEYLRRIFRVPVHVENDVNLAALGEMHFGACQGVQNFVLIRLTTGVGAGLGLGGKLFQGNHWAAGEIGHMVFGREAAAGELSDRGYLELMIGSDRLRERVRLVRANEAVQAALSGGGETNGEPPDSLGLDDPAAAGIVEDLASHLGLAAADLVAVIDPELIVLNGELFDLVTEQIRDVVRRVIPWPVRIERSVLGEEGALLGAIGSARGLAHELICDTGHSESRVRK